MLVSRKNIDLIPLWQLLLSISTVLHCLFMGEGQVVPSKCCAVFILLLTNRKDLIGPGSALVLPQIILERFSTLLFQSRNWNGQNITGANWFFSDGRLCNFTVHMGVYHSTSLKSLKSKGLEVGGGNQTENKLDRATMRPDCVSPCTDHVICMERHMDKQTGKII